MITSHTYVESHVATTLLPAEVCTTAMVNEMHVTKMRFSTNTENTGRMRELARNRVAAWPVAGTGKTS